MLQMKIHSSEDAVQQYLTDTFNLLNAARASGLDQPEILEAAYEFDELVNPGERETLLAALENARRNVQRVVDEGTQKPDRTDRVRELGIGT
jgi:hypothetical protein